jgi:HAD superfamily hydrolase (TIGR01509 family)
MVALKGVTKGASGANHGVSEPRACRRAVIFDMDGVIVDSEPRHERAFLEVVESIGYGEGRHGLRFADYVGRSDKELWVDFVARNQPLQSLEELLALKRQRVVDIIRHERPLFDGLPALVRQLARHYKLALASGSERAVVEEVLELDGLRALFPAVVSGSDITRGKPQPDIFLKAAGMLGVSPGDCWVVEDSKPGIAAGLAAGMRVVAITNTHRAAELAHAHQVVSTYEEIGQLLLPARHAV